MKKIFILLLVVTSLFSKDIMVFENSYDVLHVNKRIKEISVGDKSILNLSMISGTNNKALKIFGKKIGYSSILVFFSDGTYKTYHIYVNKNLEQLQIAINKIAPHIKLSKVGESSLVINGEFKDKKTKEKVYTFLKSAGVDVEKIVDVTSVNSVDKMVRTKMYLVEINNQRAKDLGGVTGLGFFSKYLNTTLNPESVNGATFSGFLLDHTAALTANSGFSIIGTLNFLEEKGIAKILDDTVLVTTEDKNASFHVGGEVYIPVGITYNSSAMPTIHLEEKEYGLKLTLNTSFMQKDGFVQMKVDIEDSEFDQNKEHDVQLGQYTEVPSFISKNISTDIIANDRQVIALGGRLHSEEIKNEEKIPLLGDIPIVGEAFKRNETISKTNDLLFFLVPHIVDPNEKRDDTNFYKDTKKDSQKMGEKLSQVKEKLHVDDKKKSVEKEQNIYEISAKKVFVRDAPANGEVKAVWIEGHKFIASQESSNWLKIEEDCYEDNCIKLEEPLWVSRSYVKNNI